VSLWAEDKKKEMTEEERNIQLKRLYYVSKLWISEVPTKQEKEAWEKKHGKDEDIQDGFFNFCADHRNLNSQIKREDLIHFVMTFCKIMESETYIIPSKVQEHLTERNVDIAIGFLIDQVKDGLNSKKETQTRIETSSVVEKEKK
jgi:hypothetical protein